MEHIIDATGKTIGRTATQAAVILMGKNTPDFKKNKIATTKVHITNASKIKLDLKKLTTVLHERYSGYPGGLKQDSVEKIIKNKGYAELFKLAVYGMLPGNKLRTPTMKNLKITE